MAYTILSKRQIFYKHSTLSKSEINISLIQTHFLVLSLTTNGLKICLLDNYVSYLLGWQLLKEIALLHVCRHSHTDSLLWCLSLECHPTLLTKYSFIGEGVALHLIGRCTTVRSKQPMSLFMNKQFLKYFTFFNRKDIWIFS